MTDETKPEGGETTFSTDPVVVKLKSLGVSEDIVINLQTVLGVSTEADLASLTEADLMEAGMKKIPARKLLAALAPVVETEGGFWAWGENVMGGGIGMSSVVKE